MFDKKKQILHIFNDPKFSVGYVEFLSESGISPECHEFFHYRTTANSYPSNIFSFTHSKSFFSLIPNIKLLILLFKSEKVIVHCLAAPFLLVYLSVFPTLSKKVYWVIWGKDLYFYKVLKKKRFYHKAYELLRRCAIAGVPNVITDNLGDYELLKKWYGVNPRLFRSFSYPSNLHQEQSNAEEVPARSDSMARILVGNSADPSNEHLEVFKLLEKFKEEDIQIIVPLSYGDKAYAKEIARVGKDIFGNKLISLMELIPLDEYRRLQHGLDIAIFAHKRQQAMGNIISLLGMGKKVYLRSDISTWRSLKSYDLNIEDMYHIELTKISAVDKEANMKIVKSVYSKENLLKQWQAIFAAET